MLTPNMRYAELKDSYLFNTIYRKTDEYLTAHPGKQVLRMGVGDVSLPLCDAVIKALLYVFTQNAGNLKLFLQHSLIARYFPLKTREF